MASLFDQLSREHQAFITGTSYILQFYETQDGTRFARQPDGSYEAGPVRFASLAAMFEETLGPIAPGQLYALVAAYHPLVRTRLRAGNEHPPMSRSEARSFILEDFTDVTPLDVSMDAGTLVFASRAQRQALFPLPNLVPEPEPEPELPRPPRQRAVRANIEVMCLADGALSTEAIKDRVEHAVSLVGDDELGEFEITAIEISDVPQPAKELVA